MRKIFKTLTIVKMLEEATSELFVTFFSLGGGQCLELTVRAQYQDEDNRKEPAYWKIDQ